MRMALAKYKDQKQTFRARVQCFGSKYGNEKTVLLIDICDERGNRVCDHLWLGTTRSFEGLEQGSTVVFAAKVAAYIKGYRGRKDGDWHKPIEIDYTLTNLTKVRKLD